MAFLQQRGGHAFLSVLVTLILYMVLSSIIRTFKYSTSLFRKATKCSAFLILPGIASCSKSSGSTGKASGMTFGVDKRSYPVLP